MTRQARALALTQAFMTRAVEAFKAGDLPTCRTFEVRAARAEKIADRLSR